MATYEMHLATPYFNLVKSGRKTIELRLADEKRKKLRVGDMLMLATADENPLSATIIRLYSATDFATLGRQIDIRAAGFANLEEMLSALAAIYPASRQKQLGVLGIEFKLQ